MTIRVFVTGVTGYIGSAVLSLLLQQGEKYSITALVRLAAAANALRDLGVSPVLGTLDDSDVLEQAALESDVVLNVADCAHLGAAQALVKGLRAKEEKGLLIHTSGTAIVSDDSKGEFASQQIYSDLDISAIRALPAGVGTLSLALPCRVLYYSRALLYSRSRAFQPIVNVTCTWQCAGNPQMCG